MLLAFTRPAPARAGGVPWNRLARHLQGRLVLPADAAYATAKQLDLAQYDAVEPQAVAYCAGSADVATCLAFAQDNALPIAVRSGGHSAGGYSTTRGLIIDVSGLDSVAAGAGAVTMGPGALNVDIVDALAPHGLAVSGGSCPTVAAGGFLQGGGIGMMTRHIGIASDRLTSAQVVLADGRVVTASANRNPDLFWALRGGGGGNFGVVASSTVTPTALPVVATATMPYAYDRAVDVLDGYARWLAGAPRSIGGAAFIVLPDAAPGAAPTPVVLLASAGTAAELDAEIGRLVSLTGPPPATPPATVVPYQAFMMGVYQCSGISVAQCHRTPAGQVQRLAYGLERSRLFAAPPPRSLWEQAIAAYDAGRMAGQMHQLQVLPFGGAANDLGRTATAYVHRGMLCSVNFLGAILAPPAGAEAVANLRAWVDRGFATIDPYSTGETYQNFIDPALADWKASYYAENYQRLASVKAAYDPCGLFTFAQGIR